MYNDVKTSANKNNSLESLLALIYLWKPRAFLHLIGSDVTLISVHATWWLITDRHHVVAEVSTL